MTQPSDYFLFDPSIVPDNATFVDIQFALGAADNMARLVDAMIATGQLSSDSPLALARTDYNPGLDYKWSRPSAISLTNQYTVSMDGQLVYRESAFSQLRKHVNKVCQASCGYCMAEADATRV